MEQVMIQLMYMHAWLEVGNLPRSLHYLIRPLTGIYLSNTPGAVDDATATAALYLLISTIRQFSIAERSLRSLKWKPAGLNERTHDLTGKTLAILGLGGIGTRLAVLVHAFPMRVVYHSRHKNPDAPNFCEYFENVEKMLAQADVLSVHVPLRPETVGLVSEKWIRALKPGAIIINTARGKVIDEDAMIRALEDGHVSYIKTSRSNEMTK
jgi:glyoxylate reductase